ncbi:hypothetical protein PI124_g22089, partial [Phytophthora idaei]
NRSHFQRSQTRNSSHAVTIAAHHGTERALGLASSQGGDSSLWSLLGRLSRSL